MSEIPFERVTAAQLQEGDRIFTKGPNRNTYRQIDAVTHDGKGNVVLVFSIAGRETTTIIPATTKVRVATGKPSTGVQIFLDDDEDETA